MGSNISTYTEAMAEYIEARISDGDTLREVCREADMPAWRTVYDWMKAQPDFAARIARARELGEEAILADALRIADTPIIGVSKTLKSDGSVEAKEEDMLGHRKLQIETRLKLLAKWNPKKYGDKVTHSGDPTAPISLILNGSDVNG